MDDLLYDLDRAFGYPKVDHRGERWVLCAFHADRKIGSFSYSPRGYRCFACDAKGGLGQLAEQIGLRNGFKQPILYGRRANGTPKRFYDWMDTPDYWRRYVPLAGPALDYARSRGLNDASIERWRIGYGVLPVSRCHHPRLIIPIFVDRRLTGLRGRHMGCECPTKDKWLQAAGSMVALFGGDRLQRGDIIVITEAPISAMLAMQEAPDVKAVAICGANIWHESWTELIARKHPERVLVWLDNDDAGRTGGVKIVNSLLAASVRAQLYRWPVGFAAKADLADVAVTR